MPHPLPPARRAGALALLMLLPALPLLLTACDPVAGGAGLVARDGSVDWNRYYTADETNRILRAWAHRYPELTRLYTIGQSFLGADLMVMEVSNRDTGPAEEKPALYLDGGIHAGELTSSAVALYVLGQLLTRYGEDPQITRLVDTRTFYIRPKFNPDGSDLVLHTDTSIRSSVRPFDDDEDGLTDEDPPNDLNGDGRITRMRIPDPEGNYALDPGDPRIMVPRRAGESTGPFYRLMPEGIDSDGDGRYNEDGIGGLDMNRNFPRNWEPEYLQSGAGAFPLSEPETYATVRFIVDHPNIVGIVHGHTSGGFVYRLPSAMDPARMDPGDVALVQHLGAEYTRTTGRPVRPSATHPTERRYGTLIGWAYLDRGIVGWVPEYVPALFWVTDYDGDGRISEQEQHRFNDELLGGKYFTPWTPFEHPQLGRVEIGGWWTRFWGQNPPAEFLEQECTAQLPWILYLIEQAPVVEVSAPRVTPLGQERYRVEVTVTNTGFLPTHMTEQGHLGRRMRDGSLQAQLVRPPYARIEGEGFEIVEGSPRLRLGHLAGASSYGQAVSERSVTASWVVMPTAPAASVRVEVTSDTGGTVRTDRYPLP